MIKYAISIASFQPKRLADVGLALRSPTFSNLIFPAELPIAPNKMTKVLASSDFDVSLIPKEFIDQQKTLAHIPLYSKNGIEFDSTIYLDANPVIPNVLGVRFTSEHLESGIISLKTILRLLEETIPIFESDQASVYDTYLVRIPNQMGGYGFEKRKFLRTDDGLSYPLDIEWITYFGPRMLDILGRERFGHLRSCSEKLDIDNGILVILQKEPFDKRNPEHVRRKQKAEKELGFDDFVRK